MAAQELAGTRAITGTRRNSQELAGTRAVTLLPYLSFSFSERSDYGSKSDLSNFESKLAETVGVGKNFSEGGGGAYFSEQLVLTKLQVFG